jgi:hypothetical protein
MKKEKNKMRTVRSQGYSVMNNAKEMRKRREVRAKFVWKGEE